MSASSKKKLRNAQEAEKLTERQLSEQKEAKKLKIYTAAFIIVTVILLVTAITVGVMQIIDNSGIREKNSVAMTVGDEKINAVEMTYFYYDAVQEFYSTYSDYIAYFIDTTTPLNEQYYDAASGMTWADYFLQAAQSNAEYVYTLCSAAKAEGYTLSDEEKAELDATVSTIELYASVYTSGDTEAYLKSAYGPHADMDGFLAYQENVTLANSYRNAYYNSLSYDAAAIEEAQKDTFDNYSSFTYNSYYISASRFLEGGTEDENGTVVYSDEEKAASISAAEAAAKALCDGSIDSVEALDEAIAAMPVNAELTSAKSTTNSSVLYTSIDSAIAQWLAQDHQEGEMGYVASESTSADGVTTVNGYYVLYFVERNDNNMFLPTVRHILVGSEDVLNGTATYTEEDLAGYKADAEALLQLWKDTGTTEENFAALATSNSIDSGSVSTGGLYENIVPGQMVDAFNDWCFGKHQVGDTGIVETEYGYHIMYFSGLSEKTYREQMVIQTLSSQDLEAWYNGILEKYPVTLGESTYLPMDMTLG